MQGSINEFAAALQGVSTCCRDFLRIRAEFARTFGLDPAVAIRLGTTAPGRTA